MSGKNRPTIPTIQNDKAPSFSVPGWAIWAVIIFTTILYSRALFNGLTSIDDDFYVVHNPYLKDFSFHGIKEIFTSFYASNYHPFTTLSLLIETKLFGTNPLVYHLDNVLLHLLNVWLAYKLAERLSNSTVTAFIVALFFAIHPMHVESVAWVSERKDVLYSAFYLLSLICYLSYIDASGTGKYYFLSLSLFLCSLFAKSAAVTLPLILLLFDMYRGRKLSGSLVAEKLPFFALSILFGILAMLSQKAGGAVNEYVIASGFLSKLFTITSGLSFYIIRLFAPVGLSILHYSPYVLGKLPWIYYLSIPFIVLLIWLIIRPSPLRKELVFGALFFLSSLTVMLQIVPVGSAYVAERYTYIAYIGLFYIIGQVLSSVSSGKNRMNILLGIIGISLVFSFISWQRIEVWKDDEHAFNDLVSSNPDIYEAYLFRGGYRKKQNDLTGALEDFSRAIELNPTYERPYYLRAGIYDALNDLPSAIADFTKFLEAEHGFAEAYNNRGWAYFRTGNVPAAIADYNKALSIDSAYVDAYNNRGWAYLSQGNSIAALPDFTKAIVLNPKFDKPYYNRTGIWMKAGDYAHAVEDYTSILALHPDDVETIYRRGEAYHLLNNDSSACTDWQKAAQMGNSKATAMLQQYCH